MASLSEQGVMFVTELDQDAECNLLTLQGDSLSVTGFGDDASVFMQTLSRQPWLREVSAPSAFQRDRRSGKERFSIDAVISPTADQEGSADED